MTKASFTNGPSETEVGINVPRGSVTGQGQSGWNFVSVDETGALFANTFPNELMEAQYSGKFRGKTAKVVFILGRRTVFNAANTFQDVCPYLVNGQNLINTPVVGTTYYLNSTSLTDAVGGPGAVTVRIVYLDAAGDQQVRTDTLTGQTPVSIGAGYTFFQWMEVASVTGSETSNGDITIGSINGAATEATTMDMIKAGGNRSLCARYKVPTGYAAFLHGWYSSAVAQAMDTRLRATSFADDNSLSSVFHFKGIMYLSAGQSLEKDLHEQKCPAGTIIKISTIPAAITGSPRIDATLHLVLIAN